MGVDQLMQRLEQWDKWPPAWEPEAPGEIIAGRVLEYTTGESPYGRCHVVVLDVQGRQLNGRKAAHPARLAVWLSKEVLFREFKQHRPRRDELVAIKYVGPPNKDTAYHQYKVLVERAEKGELEPLGGEEPAAAAPQARQTGNGHKRTVGDLHGDLGVSRADLPRQRSLVGARS